MKQFREGDKKVEVKGSTFTWTVSRSETTAIDKDALKADGLLDKYSKNVFGGVDSDTVLDSTVSVRHNRLVQLTRVGELPHRIRRLRRTKTMARIPMTSGFTLIPEGTYVFLIYDAKYDEEFGPA